MSTLPDYSFDSILELAMHLCEASGASLNLFDAAPSSLTITTGTVLHNHTLHQNLIEHITKIKEIAVIPDISTHPQFSSHASINQTPEIRFFAGIPIISDKNHIQGVLCIYDASPKQLNIAQHKALRALTQQLTQTLSIQNTLKDLEHEKKKYAALLQISGDGVHIFDRDGYVIDVNEIFCKMLGYSRQELLGMNVSDWDAGFSSDSLKNKVQQTFSNPEVFDTKHKRKDGTVFDVEISAQPVWIDNRLYLWNASRDITDRKRHEASRENLLRIIEESTDFIGTADEHGNIQYLNKTARKMFGITENHNLANLRISDFHPDWASKIVLEQGIPYAIQHGHWFGENALLTVDKNEIPISQSLLFHDGAHGEPPHFSTIIRDISARKEFEASLYKAKEAAELANRAKSDFLTGMSHELRTPLNIILGFSQLLQMDSALSEQSRHQITKIVQAGKLLLTLVNDLLDLGRIEAGKLQLQLEAISVNAFFSSNLEIFKSMAEQHNIEFIYRSSIDDNITIHADHARLSQVVINLLSNAIKYNRPQGNVTLTCDLTGDKVRISVIDTGLGIPPNARNRIFTPFDRLGKEGGTIEGTGIGLAICKKLTDEMGGIINFDSIHGQGSTFWMEFLASTVPNHSISDAGNRKNSQSTTASNFRILLVEDNPVNQMLACAILEKLGGYTVDTADNGTAAVKAIHAGTYHLILMDCLMPEMDGFEATRIIRQIETDTKKKRTPIVAMTANATEGNREACLACGMDDYIVKPIDIALLQETLRHWLNLSNAQ